MRVTHAAPAVRSAVRSAVSGRRYVHAVEITGSAIDGAGGSASNAPRWRRLTIYPVLHGRLGGAGGTVEIAQAIQASSPRQVLVELCTSRYSEVLASAILDLPAKSPPRIDILRNVHGGLLSHELVPVLRAARQVGAAVVPVDRASLSTRNRIAQLLLNPSFIKGLLRFGTYSLQRRATALPEDAEAIRSEFQAMCPGAHEVLVSERCRYMAHQVQASAASGADVIVVCGALHCSTLAQVLRQGSGSVAADVRLADLARRGMPVWPVLALGYLGLPALVVSYVASAAWSGLASPVLVPAA